MSGLTGDWKKAGVTLQRLVSFMNKEAKQALRDDGEFIRQAIVSHIDNQDLSWKPLSEGTIRLKKGNNNIYIETGTLKNCIVVRGVKSKTNGSTIFVGANPWTIHTPSGLKASTLLNYLEKGTSRIPPRPLIEPTWKELEPQLKQKWRSRIKAGIGDIKRRS